MTDTWMHHRNQYMIKSHVILHHRQDTTYDTIIQSTFDDHKAFNSFILCFGVKNYTCTVSCTKKK